MLCVPADASPDLVCDGGAVFPSVPPFSTALLAPIAKRDGIDNNQRLDFPQPNRIMRRCSKNIADRLSEPSALSRK